MFSTNEALRKGDEWPAHAAQALTSPSLSSKSSNNCWNWQYWGQCLQWPIDDEHSAAGVLAKCAEDVRDETASPVL